MAHTYFYINVFFPIPHQAPKEAQKHHTITFDLDKICQYSDGRDLLNACLVEHERLLWELEGLAKESQGDRNSDLINKLDLVKTQILLFERLMIGEKIDSLVVLMNHYADILSKPSVEIRKATVP